MSCRITTLQCEVSSIQLEGEVELGNPFVHAEIVIGHLTSTLVNNIGTALI
jgi:hypothetical protein